MIGRRARAPVSGRRTPDWLPLVGLIVASTLVRAWASRTVPTPWIAPDEMIYGLLGQSLYRTGHLAILGGPTPYYSAVVPLLAGVPLSVSDLAGGYSVLKVVQALVISLAAVPVYFWARSVVPRRWALVAAALTLALPGLAYSGLVMSEVEFYPALVLAAWAMAAAIASPTRRHGLLALGALVLAIATRTQAVILLPALVIALVLDALLARSLRRLAAQVPLLAGVALLAAAGALWRLAAAGPFLGGYAGAGGQYPAGRALRYVVYHAGDLVLLAGVIPVCAVAALAWNAARRGEPDERVRSYLAVAVALTVCLVVEVGVFASREVGQLAERNLIGLAPVLFVGFSTWLARNGPGGFRTRAAAAILAAAAVLAIPLGRFVNPDALPSAFSIVPLLHLRELSSLHTTELVLGLGVAAAAFLFVIVPRRALLVLPALVGLALVGGSVSASREVVAQAKAQQPRLIGPERRWIDRRATGPVAYIYDGGSYWNTVWETLFWNRRVESVLDLPDNVVPGPLPQTRISVRPNGVLTDPAGAPFGQPFAVIAENYQLAGQPLATAPQLGTDRYGFTLWQVDKPLRVSTVRFGLLPNGDIDPARGLTDAGLITYACGSGSFKLALFVKEPETIRILLDNRVVRRRRFPATGTWYVTIPIRRTSAGDNRVCVLSVRPTGLTGTNRFEFQR